MTNFCKAASKLILLLGLTALVGCTGISPDYERPATCADIPRPLQAVSNALTKWAGSLTNNYRLLLDSDARQEPPYELWTQKLPGVLFLVMNKFDDVSPWGLWQCRPHYGKPFTALVVIRLQETRDSTRVFAAVHGSRIKHMLVLSPHSGFATGYLQHLPPCKREDEDVLTGITRQVEAMAQQTR